MQNSTKPDNAGHSHQFRLWRRFRHNRRGMTGMILVILMALIALLSPLLAGNQPIICRYQGKWYCPALVELFQMRSADTHWLQKAYPFNIPQFNAKISLGPEDWALWPLIPYGDLEQTSECLSPPSSQHWLGTDDLGRDVAARMIHGTAISLSVGFIAMAIATGIGLIAGALTGYWGGWLDLIISRIIEIVACFPVFFLILSIMVWLEPGIFNIMLIIGLTRWTGIARYTRSEFLRLKQQEYVTAARALGIPNFRIMFRQILPNALAPLLVCVTFGMANTILLEAGLSWLGFGVQPPYPSWGNILRGAGFYTGHLVYPPCIALFLAILSYNLVGEALRDVIDPHCSVI